MAQCGGGRRDCGGPTEVAMNLSIKSKPDLVSGVFFVIVGALVVVLAGDYNPGTAARMGPGYFPRLLGALLMLIGLGVTVFSLKRSTLDPENAAFPMRKVLIIVAACFAFWVVLALRGKWGVTGLDLPMVVLLVMCFFASRELFWVLASIAVFAFLLQPAGLVIASAALIIIASLASHEFTWKATTVNFVVLTAMCWAVFAKGLSLQFPVWPNLALLGLGPVAGN
jgi:hypothetical protein